VIRSTHMSEVIATRMPEDHAGVRVVRRHHLLVRWSHWLNVPVLLGLILSGVSTYWASPVYGALSSHRQTDPSAFEMPVFAPRLIYSAAVVQGWYLLHWLEVTPFAECRAILSRVLDRLASGTLRLSPAKRHRPQNIGDALREADGAPREGKPLLDFSDWAAD